MLQEFMGVRVSFGTVGLLAASGAVIGVITADALLPLFSLATGAAVGVVYLWTAPRQAEVRSQVQILADQLQRLDEMLADETTGHDRTREQLRLAKAALAEAGLGIPHREGDSASP
jgi:hypothetical protein